MIDVEAESQAMGERSAELAERLRSLVPEVNRDEIREVQAESRRLAAEATRARDQIAEMVRKGQPLPAGVTVGLQPPIRKVPSGGRDRKAYETLQGRPVISPELLEYWCHRRDVVGPAIVRAHETAALDLPPAAALLACARGHLASLRTRGAFVAEGGLDLEVALKAVDAVRGQLIEGVSEGQAVTTEATGRLESLAGQLASVKVASSGVEVSDVWLAGRIAGALGIDVIGDLTNPLGGVQPPAPTPVTGKPAAQVKGRSAAEHDVLLRDTLMRVRAEAAEAHTEQPEPAVWQSPNAIQLRRGIGSIYGMS